ncbi:MAG TPA: CoA transferase [Candidatus Binataceae bacterium]|nr:CoA transferase [Candidatus Binataceae bacterium]
MSGPLNGIRVVDWTIWQQGPFSTTMLADFGAEVIKIEEAKNGDPGRGLASVGGTGVSSGPGRNFYLEANNRHKKSVALNLKHPEGHETVCKLAQQSDVFVQNFRKGVARRLGLDYETLRRYNPRLIYASASGYGPLGPDADQPSFDGLGQARSGFLYSVNQPVSEPLNISGGVADQMGGIMLAFGIVMALVARERLGVGQEVDASHLGSMMALQGLSVSSKGIVGKEIGKAGREATYNPLFNHYKCADDKWLALAMMQADRYWKDFCRTMGLEAIVEDPRFVNMAARSKNCRQCIAVLDSVFLTKPRDYWLSALREGGDFIFTVVNTISDLENDPQVIANEYIVDYEHPSLGAMKLLGLPVRLSATPGEPRGRAPEHGEHTELVLSELLGYKWEDIDRLHKEGVI